MTRCLNILYLLAALLFSLSSPTQASIPRGTFSPEHTFGLPSPRETVLAEHGFRYYDPEIGRYISRDPIGYGDGLNVYLYVHNNPINHIDPLGLAPDVTSVSSDGSTLEYSGDIDGGSKYYYDGVTDGIFYYEPPVDPNSIPEPIDFSIGGKGYVDGHEGRRGQLYFHLGYDGLEIAAKGDLYGERCNAQQTDTGLGGGSFNLKLRYDNGDKELAAQASGGLYFSQTDATLFGKPDGDVNFSSKITIFGGNANIGGTLDFDDMGINLGVGAEGMIFKGEGTLKTWNDSWSGEGGVGIGLGYSGGGELRSLPPKLSNIKRSGYAGAGGGFSYKSND